MKRRPKSLATRIGAHRRVVKTCVMQTNEINNLAAVSVPS